MGYYNYEIKRRPFEEAREWARTLKLKGQKEWYILVKTSDFPEDIRKEPSAYDGWISWTDWLDTNNIFNRIIIYRPFEEAREFVRSLGLKDTIEWNKYKKSSDFPSDIRRHPYVYEEWKGMSDWLGIKKTNLVTTKKEKKYCSFEEAREFSRSLDFKTVDKWIEYTKSENFPSNIRKYPTIYDEWVDWDNWFNKDSDNSVKIFISFNESRLFARSLGFKTKFDWLEYTKTSDFPYNIRKDPTIYDEWVDWLDWLNSTRKKKNRKPKKRPFEEAREWARSLKLKSQVDWHNYVKSAIGFPSDIRRSPNQYKEWVSWFDWLDK